MMMFDLGGMRNVDYEGARDFRVGGALYAFLMRWMWQPLSRDITLVHNQLLDSGGATWLGDVLVTARVPAESDLDRAVEAVKELLGQS